LKVDVKLTGRFRDIFQAGHREVEIEEKGNVRDLLNLLCDTDDRRKIIFNKSNRGVRPNVTVTKNGRFIIHLDWLDTTLADGDKVTIFTQHCGG